MTTNWMWNDDGAVWSLSLDIERQTVAWSDAIGCACSGSFAEQTFADFVANGPRYGNPPPAIVDEVQAVLQDEAALNRPY